MKKIIGLKISYKVMLAIAIIVLVALLLPMLYIAKYDIPVDDDLGYGAQTHAAVLSGGNIIDVLKAAAIKTVDIYFGWQGSFTSTFLMTLQPGIYGTQYYRLSAYILIGTFLIAVYYFYCRFYTDIFSINKTAAFFMATVLCIFSIELVPWPNQSFYWYNGSIYYTFFYSLMLIMFALSISYIYRGKAWRIVLISFLAFLIGGANYVTALVTVIAGVLTVIFLKIAKNKKWKDFIVPTCIAVITLVVSMIAPGNAVRQSEFQNHPGVIDSIKYSFAWGWTYVKMWANIPWLGMMIIIIPCAWNMAGQSERYVKYPYVATILSFCVLSAMYTPHIYATGTPGPERIQNIVFFAFMLLSMMNAFLWCSFIRGKLKSKSSGYNLTIALCTAVIAAGCVFIPAYKGQINLTTALAIGEMRNGEAQNYYNEQIKRIEILENPEVTDAVLDPLENMPFLLFSGELTTDPTYYMNEDAATYYQKNTIVVR